MLQRKADGSQPLLRTYGFLVGIEIEPGVTTPEQVALRIADGLTWMEGCGACEVEQLGEIQQYEPDSEVTITKV